jgi:aspartyl-tRNA(Asn)/glutamyl-tRNA(Gln) amidotransferase subunit B
MNLKYEAVIGLEVHAQLSTETKIFCGCSAKFGNPPNTNVCPVCLGHPGVLPVLNKKVVEYALKLGAATNCRINDKAVFARKNYFYPDLPKDYQISQYEFPFCEHGYIDIVTSGEVEKRLGITRIHAEEDAGKLIHDRSDSTLFDANRCGVPLLEIVSEPDMNSPEEAFLYLTKIRQLVRYLGVCDGNMEEGSLRCDANVSVRLKGEKKLGTRTELKNMNSFHNVEKALEYEIERQIDLIEEGGRVVQQTLLWDADKNEARAMRGKEEAHDYRYFPDPDLVPIVVSDQWKKEIFDTLPELPEAKKKRFAEKFGLSVYDAEVLTSSRELSEYYEKVIAVTTDYKSAGNWVMGDVLKTLNEKKINISDFPVKPENLGKLINLINNKTISGKIAKEVFPEMIFSGKTPDAIVKEKNLLQITDTSAIESAVAKVVDANADEVTKYLGGAQQLIGFFVGQIMRETKGKADPKAVNEILRIKLEQKRK